MLLHQNYIEQSVIEHYKFKKNHDFNIAPSYTTSTSYNVLKIKILSLLDQSLQYIEVAMDVLNDTYTDVYSTCISLVSLVTGCTY